MCASQIQWEQFGELILFRWYVLVNSADHLLHEMKFSYPWNIENLLRWIWNPFVLLFAYTEEAYTWDEGLCTYMCWCELFEKALH